MVDTSRPPAATMDDNFITTSSLTKLYGLAGLRCGWALSSQATAQRLRRVRDIVDGGGSILTERLGVLAFQHLDRLIERAQALLGVNGELVRNALSNQHALEWIGRSTLRPAPSCSHALPASPTPAALSSASSRNAKRPSFRDDCSNPPPTSASASAVPPKASGTASTP